MYWMECVSAIYQHTFPRSSHSSLPKLVLDLAKAYLATVTHYNPQYYSSPQVQGMLTCSLSNH